MALAFLINDFIAFSIIGWIYECIYCTVQTGHWQNRGFLFGPICPIYGTGAAAIIALSALVPELSEASLWQCWLFFAFGSAVLEYAVSWGLERIFHARWWDYSHMPLNLNGRICLPASAFFGIVGILFLEYLIPFISGVQAEANPLLVEASVIVSMALLGADTALSVASMSALLETLDSIQANVNEKLEDGVQFAKQLPVKVSGASEKARNTMENVSERSRDAVFLLRYRVTHTARHMLQRHHLNNISSFEKRGHRGAAEYIRQFIHRKDDDSETLRH